MIKNTQTLLNEVVQHINQVILGKEHQVRLILTCLLVRGHVLLEDVPGVGKTTLAHVFAKILGLQLQRIQFTSDLLPADIIGVSIFDNSTNQFKFHTGAVFSQMLLADEINRATPKTQSALLEAMEEHQVTVEGHTYELPKPFFVLATQNPQYQIGTFPLPESQLDRFTMRLGLGYPDAQTERQLLKGRDRREMIEELPTVMPIEQLLELQNIVKNVHVAEALIDYVQALLAHTRENPNYRHGLSPRAGLALLRCAQAWAMMQGRDHVLPEDVQTVLVGVVGHRLMSAQSSNQSAAEQLLHEVKVP